MKITKIIIFTFLFSLLSCKNDNKNAIGDNQKYVKLLWRNKQFEWIPTSLVAKNKILYFGNLNRDFYAINLENAKVNFKIKTDYNPFDKPLIYDQNLLLTEYSNDLIHLDKTGKLKWKINGETNLRNDLTEDQSYIYGSVLGNGFSKLNKTDAKIIWFLPKNSIIIETNKPAFFKNNIYLGLSEHTSELLAINNENGEIIWKKEYKNFSKIIQVKTEKGLLVCLNKDFKNGQISMLNYKSGNEIWSKSLNCDLHYEPCIINGNIILSTYNNKVISLNIENGKTNWTLDLRKDAAETTIISFKENVYFGTMNRNLYSVNFKTGKTNFMQPFNYGILNPIVEDNTIYFPTGGSEMWLLK
ncbi:outer membrane protein assembly factor BamB [Flavobacterium sp. 90]|uniref:outer membrane protein assembly factor BamB family protein n=1 Tax=unclassified Flavobacterium TaxID=196869 RepID=UPI000EAF1E0F|nr:MULTISPECIES: PQQ-binding-like beta-propeller repeat protein [unclassified Flavobacterium]RKR08784.1 outer membrane protein assembly factor BamB [Flavobacterium sp. 81]TCK52571.1 outer membrane protein assembly factor BamB [Flavobacterium sp. 90]